MDGGRAHPKVRAAREGFSMATPGSASTMTPPSRATPVALFNVCFVLCVINIVYFPIAYLSHC
jgi:hypothetical protein